MNGKTTSFFGGVASNVSNEAGNEQILGCIQSCEYLKESSSFFLQIKCFKWSTMYQWSHRGGWFKDQSFTRLLVGHTDANTRCLQMLQYSNERWRFFLPNTNLLFTGWLHSSRSHFSPYESIHHCWETKLQRVDEDHQGEVRLILQLISTSVPWNVSCPLLLLG